MSLKVLTIGHSNHSFERFAELLISNRVQHAVDTRSYPYSRFASQFNREPFEASLAKRGIRYLYLGGELGGRPREKEYYDGKGHLLADRLTESPRFGRGIARLMSEIENWRCALICAEENPAQCHRRGVISPILMRQGVSVAHIRKDGSVENEKEITARSRCNAVQIALF